MISRLCLLLLFSSLHLNAAIVKNDALQAKDDAIQALNQLNPATLFKEYTSAPPESRLQPHEYSSQSVIDDKERPLYAEGLHRASEDKTATMVLDAKKTRPCIKPNPKSVEIEYAERLIDNAEAALNPACHKEPVPCQDTIEKKTCEESSGRVEKTCEDTSLNIHLHETHAGPVTRLMFLDETHREGSINLTQCNANEQLDNIWKCGPKSLFTLHPRCEHLEVRATIGNKKNSGPVTVIKQPTCENPIATLGFAGKKGLILQVELTEFWSDEDTATTKDCSKEALDRTLDACALESVTACVSPNATRVINGVPITRPCWGHAMHYQCSTQSSSTCKPLMDEGCSHVVSLCTAYTDNHCDHLVQTFECSTRTCFPDKTVCPAEVACADGQCDDTTPEVSDDINEGLSRLGALGGTAEDVATNQVDLGQARIFQGVSQKCEKYIWGMRDCCTDKGFLKGVLNCPKELQALQRAKVDGRVVFVGDYKDGLFERQYVFCVFPTKLAGIIQIQGRGAQLHIPFGEAKSPYCRGITPEELEKIDFKQLDISALVEEFTGRKQIPSFDNVDNINTNHVERLVDEGRAHD